MCVYNDTGKNTTSASETLLNKRIAIVGIGGVGGYLGAMLAHAYPHVTLAARGKRLEHIKEHGLTLHSVYSGEITAFPEHVTTADAIGPQDYIFVCVKNYSLEDVCRQITPFVDDHTVLNTGNEWRRYRRADEKSSEKRHCYRLPYLYRCLRIPGLFHYPDRQPGFPADRHKKCLKGAVRERP